MGTEQSNATEKTEQKRANRSNRNESSARPGPGPGRPAARAGRDAGPRTGGGTERPDAGLAVHVLPRRRAADGARSGRQPRLRPACAAVRGRAPVQLRRLRVARAAAGLRRQRLRRDAARAVRVGRQASGRQPGRGRAGQRVRRQPTPARSRCRAARYRHAMRAFAVVRHAHALVLPHRRAGHHRPVQLCSCKKGRPSLQALAPKARTRHSSRRVAKLTTVVDGQRPIVSDSPPIVPIHYLLSVQRAAPATPRSAAICTTARPAADRRTCSPFRARPSSPQGGRGRQRRHPRAGSCCWRPRRRDPLFLQAKQASLCARASPGELLRPPRQRVVEGQRLMQAASDIFLGWQRIARPRRRPHRTSTCASCATGSAPRRSSTSSRPSMAGYGELCAWTLARAHARTGDRFAIAAYLGRSDSFRRGHRRLLGQLRQPERARPRRPRQPSLRPVEPRRV